MSVAKDQPILVERLPIPFFRQLRDQGRSSEELDAVKRTLDLAREVFGARTDFDGGPAISHFIGAASVASWVGLPTPYVCFALVHNIYRSGIFADGEPYGASEARRSHVRARCGTDVEAMAFERFQSTELEYDEAPPPAANSHRALMELADLCELYEKYENGRIHAANPDRADRSVVERDPEVLVERARRLSGDRFADQLELALAREADIPTQARSGLTYGEFKLPAGTVPHPAITARRARSDARHQFDRGLRWLRRKGRGVRRRLRRSD